MPPSLAPISLLLVLAGAGVSPVLAQQEGGGAAQQQPAVQQQPAAQDTAPAAATTELTDKEKAVLQKIRALKAPRWRSFGSCRYDWSAWRLAPEAVRTTLRECGVPPVAEAVAVHCATFKVSARSGDQPWSSWRLPLATSESSSRGGEDLMVAALCANAQTPAEPPTVSAPTTAKPSPTKPAATAKPTATAKPAAPARPAATAKPASTAPKPAPVRPQ
jgi:hypothetical protein